MSSLGQCLYDAGMAARSRTDLDAATYCRKVLARICRHSNRTPMVWGVK